ncbi:MAG: Bifunctional protein HldE [Acidobacteria bacterium]|nr:Bifunctional protein HldE [Acidobacteriota bacterium]
MITTSPSTAAFRTAHKIVPVDGLSAVREQSPGRRIVLCHGAFDLVHMGHLIHFEEARALGDVLVVTITADRHITKKRSVSFSQDYRARQLAALEVVDYVAIVDEPSAVTPIERLRPDVYVKGPEYANLLLDKTANIVREKALVEAHGGSIHFTNGATFSSTKLAHFLLAAPEASQSDPLLSNDRVLFRDLSAFGFTLEQLKGFLGGASALRVCLIGETIVDEWVDVQLTNLSQKSRCMAGLEVARSRQIGGTGAIARHLSTFVATVDCFTNGPVGALGANVTSTSIADDQLVKSRFVDCDTGFRIFESKSPDLRRIRHDALPDFDAYDVVLISDFGHGLIDAPSINARIAGRSRAFVAAMAQVNSTNYGYNLPTKFVGVDYCSLNRTEAELCLRDRGLPLALLVERMAALLQVPTLSVTDGEHGAMVARRGEQFILPAVSTNVVDTIGCGDAYFALSSLAAALHCPPGIIAVAGSIGAAAVAQRRGNEAPTCDQEFLTIGKIVV